MKNELFILGHDVWATLKRDEVDATVRDLSELGLYKLPYPLLDVQLTADDLLVSRTGDDKRQLGPRYTVIVHNVSLDNAIRDVTPTYMTIRDLHHDVIRIDMSGRAENLDNHKVFGNDAIKSFELRAALIGIIDALIVVLATRNAVKTRRENKLAKLGIGAKKHPYRFVTTISLPRVLEDADGESAPTGEHRRPHLRRGHIRRQHYGPGGQFVKQVFIAPVFVNADRDWVDARVAYNVGTKKENA